MSTSFVTTRWTLVIAAAGNAGDSGGTDDMISRQALSALCSTYWPPLYAHARRGGLSASDAEDAVQGFFARLLRLDSIADARRERGRFRAFLLGSFNHYLADMRDHARAEKRGAHLLPPLDTIATERALDLAEANALAPDQAFDRAWALALLDNVAAHLRADYANAENAAHFDALFPCIAGRNADTPHATLAHNLGLTEPAVRVALHRMRQQYRRLLRKEIRDTVASADDVDAELRHLLAALSRND